MSQELTERKELLEPAEIDRSLVASLPLSVRSSLRIVNRDRIDPVYGYDYEFSHYEIGEVPSADLMEARRVTSPHIQGCDERTLAQELTRLRAVTKSRGTDHDDLKLIIAVYAEEMAAYPADCVIWACRKWARMETFWPSWAELKELLDRAARKRLALWKAVTK